jgi:predicted restriction endonuclease
LWRKNTWSPSICRDCNHNTPDRSRQTLGEIQKAAKYQISALLRHVARQTYKHSQRPYICHTCGYDKHVEICHIRAINTFPDDTPVSVVSGIDNLIALCPNCHWEFDNGLLHLQGTQNEQ